MPVAPREDKEGIDSLTNQLRVAVLMELWDDLEPRSVHSNEGVVKVAAGRVPGAPFSSDDVSRLDNISRLYLRAG